MSPENRYKIQKTNMRDVLDTPYIIITNLATYKILLLFYPLNL